MLDFVDNWFKFVRVEFIVLVDNEKVIKFYEFLGFKIEGIKKYVVIKNGKYVDEYIMVRYNF